MLLQKGSFYKIFKASPTAVVKFDKNYVGETAGSIAGEFRIPWADNMDPEVGHVLGFLAAVLDDINNDDGIEYATFYGEHRDMDLEPARKKTGPWDKMILTDVTYVAPEEPTETPDEPTETPEEPTETPDEPTETPDEPAETPDEPTETPDEPAETPNEEPPAKTLDAGLVVAVSVMAIAAGVVLTKKK